MRAVRHHRVRTSIQSRYKERSDAAIRFAGEIRLQSPRLLVLATILGMSTPSPVSVSEFLASLPATYRTVFDSEAASEHAAIVSRRSGAFYIEVWREMPDDLYVLCLVADDRPGLLSTITTALSSVGFHIEAAQIFTRKSIPVNEALDFFWVRLDPPATLETVRACVHKVNNHLHSRAG